ncbi:hypothetical protein FHX42_003978 [Saccharopolyspora lacisalsi]|uniref:Copper chaperone PCu(A)C n=1 Tax=Halosaccharopolyspora lacisalsi TaxID=1000566 RepID=A0A839E115_9PSEU|nr:hypothetical protein [Halosaccharopolyspora lacisalsi]MBA8826599.1 hypothetical protein [Halosaccharopolyspora lacisalsi]
MSRPQYNKAVRLRLAPVVIGLGAVMALTGCSAGQDADTSEVNAAVFGDNAQAGSMAVRDAVLAFPGGEAHYPKGSSAPMDVVLINKANAVDRLIGASSPYAKSVRITGDTTIPGGTRLHSNGESPKRQQSTSATRQPTSAAEQPQQTGPVQHPQVNIALVGLTQTIRPGTVVPVTLRFRQAGEITVHVPIGPSPESRPEHGSPH